MHIDAQGKLLVAPPGMPDPRFAKTVVFIWKHDVSGASGVIINKRCQRPTFEHVCQEGGIKLKPGVNPPVYYGGPVLNNVVGVLHSTEYRLASTNTLIEGTVGFTLDSKILEDVARGGGPLNRMITLGMAQLEQFTVGGGDRTPTHTGHELVAVGLRRETGVRTVGRLQTR